MKQKVISEVERNNKAAMTAHMIEAIVMIMFCLLQVASGLRSGVLFLLDVILGLGPVMGEIYFWKRNHETSMIKHLVGIGFAVFYTFTLFTCNNNMVFVFVIPMILMISIFNDTKYSIQINVGTVILSLIMSIAGARTGTMGYEGMDDAIVMVVAMLLVAVFSIYASKIAYQNSSQKLEEAQNAQKESEALLADMKFISQKLDDGMQDIYGELEKLTKASDITKESMTQLSAGAAETADAVQKQTNQTEAIQSRVGLVMDSAESITKSMQQTLQVLEEGKDDVGLLVSQVDASVKNGAEAAQKLQKLDNYVEEMNSIIKLISGIANQTSMLALNASIEAARAGEAGRGFAVVASQVTGMASQTKDATVHITDLITNVSAAINEVVTVIQQMLQGIQEEKQSTANTAESFQNIQTNTVTIRENVQNLVQSIDKLKEANDMIAESIQTISAISEEVSAHANETALAEQENVTIIYNIDKKMQNLIQYIKK